MARIKYKSPLQNEGGAGQVAGGPAWAYSATHFRERSSRARAGVDTASVAVTPAMGASVAVSTAAHAHATAHAATGTTAAAVAAAAAAVAAAGAATLVAVAWVTAVSALLRRQAGRWAGWPRPGRLLGH